MSTTLRELSARLGVSADGVVAAAADLDDATPWYAIALAGFGTWVGALLVGLALAVSSAFNDEGARLVGGAFLLGLAPLCARLSRTAAATQAALIAVIAGELLFLSAGDIGHITFAIVAFLVQLAVIAAVNRPLIRALATAAALTALIPLLHELGLPPEAAAPIAGAIGVVGFLGEVSWLRQRWSRVVRPVASAALVWWPGFWAFDAVTGAFHFGRSGLEITAPWLHSILGAAALVGVAVWKGVRGLRLMSVVVAASAGASLSLAQPGLVAAFVVIAVGIACRARLLIGFAGAFVIFFLWVTYWRLDVTLLDKSLWSIALGVLVLVVRAVVGRFAVAVAPLPSAGGLRALRGSRDAALTIAALVVFVVAIGGLVVDKEQTLRHGRRVLLPLQPRDPRSLAQGDYMVLRTALAEDAQRNSAGGEVLSRFVIATVDDNDVATFAGFGELAGTGQVRFKLHGGARGLRVGAEEMFFPEGDADRFSAARFGEVRVDDDGTVVLVGLCGADRQPL